MTDNQTAYTFQVTPKAVEQIKNQLHKRGTPQSFLRLGIKGGGCSGYSYVLQFEDNSPKERDLIFKFDDVNVVIDKKSIIYLNGATLDWQQTLLTTGYKFINPNEKSNCGCGLSFGV